MSFRRFYRRTDCRQFVFSLFALLLSLVMLVTAFHSGVSAAEAAGPRPETPAYRLTLTDCVLLSLINNIDVKSAYLDRVINRYTLKKAEQDYLFPEAGNSLTLSTNTSSSYSTTQRMQGMAHAGNFLTSLALPTGGTVAVTWNNQAQKSDMIQNYGYGSPWALTFNQPLLKGGGLENAAYNVKTARIQEEKNILNLRNTISATITSAIANFRTYAKARRTQEIDRKALLRAEELLEKNKFLLAAGRMAESELIQAEADIANRQLALIGDSNNIEAARLALMQFLNIDRNIIFEPVEEGEAQVSLPSLKEALETAYLRRTDYLSMLLDLDIKKLTLAQAKRNRLWQLDLTAGTTAGGTGISSNNFTSALEGQSLYQRDWNIGLALNIPLTPLTGRQLSYMSANNELVKAEMALKKKKVDIEIEVQNGIRNAEMQYKQLEQARQARALSEKKLEIENEKLKVGRTTNFQLVSFQDELRTRQEGERDAVIAYLDALRTLDEKLGVTLNRWNVEVRGEDDSIKAPSPAKTIPDRAEAGPALRRAEAP